MARLRQFRVLLSTIPTSTLGISLILTGFLVMAIGVIIKKEFYPEQPLPASFDIFLVTLIFFFFGSVGVLWVTRRELPIYIDNIYGWPAIAIGSALVIVSWGLGLFILARYFLALFWH
jgi:hypothetical protein